jgi:TolA-binding protein
MQKGFIALCLTAWLAWLPSALGQNEEADFHAAARAFEDEQWERAERALSQFVQQYPSSARRPLAIVLRAQALCQLNRPGAAVELLQQELPGAGNLTDAFLYWLGEAELRAQNPVAAAAAFRQLLERHPHSGLRLEASVNEAAAHAAAGDWTRAAELLGDPEGAFQSAAREKPASEPAVRGQLLWAEALWRTGRPARAIEVLQTLSGTSLPAPLAWRRLWLQMQCELVEGRPSQALQTATNLVSLADTLPSPIWQARSRSALAAALEAAQDPTAAAALYRQNLATNLPPDLQEEAVLSISRLALRQGQYAQAAAALDEFLQRLPDAPQQALVLLTLGELELQQCLAQWLAGSTAPGTQGSVTNLLARARERFETLLTRFPQSPHAPKAQLDRGWCLWLTGQWDAAAEAFQAAADSLPEGYDRAVAQFKLGDIAFRQRRLSEAIAHYQALLTNSHPTIRTQLVQPALYQTLRAAVELGDLATAAAAVERLLDEFPDGHLTEASLTLQAQGLARHGDPAAARRIFQSVLERFPDTPRRPELLLAIARTCELERDWGHAAETYRAWLQQFSTHELAPQVEFNLAWTTYQTGNDAQALQIFTNFVARYPTNVLAPQAQWWIADYYLRQGPAGYMEAERHYQLLAQTWSDHPLAYEARMMAGRVAMARQAWLDAIGYFTNLTSDLNCPASIKIQALFGYGDAVRRLPPSNTNTPLANFEEAARIFAKILEFNPTNATAARAWGDIGECYLQLATRDPSQYAAASNAFHQAFTLPAADVATRSQALVGLGLVAERLAGLAPAPEQQPLLRQAMDRYLDVLYGQHLRAGEQPDLFWTRRAGLEAARLAEALQEWPRALRLYERLRDLFPPLQPTLDKRMDRIRERLAAESPPS